MPEAYEQQFQTDIAAPYSHSGLQGPGRWFKQPTGFVWTNDTDTLGLLPTVDDSETQTDFLNQKRSFSARHMSAKASFDALLEVAADSDETIQAQSGNLEDLSSTYDTTPSVPSVSKPEYGITLDDDGSVLELVKTSPKGAFIRDNGNWTLLDPDAPEVDDDTVFGREWIDVSPDAVDFYDSNSNADTLTKDAFTPYILN